MRRVILETPYKSDRWEDLEENIRFARLCARDCLMHSEAPFASHLLYTQEGVLSDMVSQERALGIEAEFAWKTVADATVVYVNRGISKGMQMGIRTSIANGQKVEYRNLPGYEKLQRPVIVTITGASGVGKTTITKKLLAERPDVQLITSFTSRSSRSSDLPGEYKYSMPKEKFATRAEEFLWTLSVHKNFYGTTKASISEALAPSPVSTVWLMILVPEVVPLLRGYLAQFEKHERRVISFYVLSPNEEELQKRLRTRGDDAAMIKQRIDDCNQWDAAALQSDIPYMFLSNNEPIVGIEDAVRQMLVFL